MELTRTNPPPPHSGRNVYSRRGLAVLVLLLLAVLGSVPPAQAAEPWKPFAEGRHYTYHYSQKRISENQRGLEYLQRSFELTLSAETVNELGAECRFSLRRLHMESEVLSLNPEQLQVSGIIEFTSEGNAFYVEVDSIARYVGTDGSRPDTLTTRDRNSIATILDDLSFPVFANDSLQPGDSVRTTRNNDGRQSTDRLELVIRGRDSTFASKVCSRYNKSVWESIEAVMELDLYTSGRFSTLEEQSELWWNADINAPVLFRQTSTRQVLRTVEGQVQMIRKRSEEEQNILRLLSVR